jgi:hypothetical protein
MKIVFTWRKLLSRQVDLMICINLSKNLYKLMDSLLFKKEIY